MNSWRTYGVAVAAIFCLGGPAVAQETHTVSGRVTNEQGQGIASVIVTAHRDGAWWDSSLKVATAGDGSFQLQLFSGDYAFTATPPRASDYVMTVYPDGLSCINDNWPTVTVNDHLSGVDFELAIGGRLAFTLLRENGSEVDFDVNIFLFNLDGGWCYRTELITLNQGAYLSPALEPGTYRVRIDTPWHDEYPMQYLCGTFDDTAANLIEVHEEVTSDFGECGLVDTETTFALTGYVTDAGGYPVAGARVSAYSGFSSEFASTVTDSSGQYSLDLPGALFQIAVFPPDDTWYVPEFYPGSYSWYSGDPVKPPLDHVDFVLEIGGRARFDLVDTSGNPIDFACSINVNAPVAPLAEREYRLWPSVSDTAGHYRSPVLPEGYSTFFLDPPPGSGFMPQWYCGQIGEMAASHVRIEQSSETELGACQLISDQYRIESKSGYLFSYDDGWILNADSSPQFLSTGVACGDLDKDGRIDVVYSAMTGESNQPHPDLETYGQTILVLVNKGENSFSYETDQWVPFLYRGGPRDIELCDMDDDSYLDLVMGNFPEPWDGRPWGERDRIWKNQAGQYFQDLTDDWMPLDDPSIYGANFLGTITHSIAVADVNNDGSLDIVRGSGWESVLLNDGTGKMFLAPPSTALDGTIGQTSLPGANGIALGDLNGDGLVDAFFTGDFFSESHFTYVQNTNPVLVGNGDGTFTPLPEGFAPAIVEPLAQGYQPVIRDFDNDGLMEVYVANINYGTENPVFAEMSPYDQYLDIQGTENGLPVFVDRTEIVEQTHQFNASWHATAADIDNDGDYDVAVANYSEGSDTYRRPEVRVLINDGDRGFSELGDLNFPAFPMGVTQVLLFDSDGDGDLDMLLSSTGYFGRQILLINDLLEKHDFTNDGFVDSTDYQRVLQRFGAVGDAIQEDLNGDGVVDSRDLSLILRYQTSVIASADNSCQCGH